jgi:hypothetical protein
MYKLPYYKESEISEEDIEREVEIGFNLNYNK